MEDILFNMLGNGQEKKNNDKEKKGSQPFDFKFYPGDAQKFAKWAVLGGMGIGLYQMGMVLSRRNTNPCIELIDKPEAMNYDPTIRDSFIHLQTYRELNPWLFSAALMNVDQLLFLTQALMNKQVPPERNDKVIAFTNFRMASIRLNMFQMLVREKLNNDQGLVAHIYVDQIYKQIQKHLLNVFHLCSSFNPKHVLQRAKNEVAAVMRAYTENKKYKDPIEKWEKIKEKSKHRRKKNQKKSSSLSRQAEVEVSQAKKDKPPEKLKDSSIGNHSRARRVKKSKGEN